MLKIRVQIYCGAEIAMGPGKADLLDAIASEGSISAAGRKLKMSYRRCWLLVDTMNRCWAEPLIATSTEGAWVTPAGQEVLALYRALYRALQQTVGAGARDHEGAVSALLRAEPLAAQAPGAAQA